MSQEELEKIMKQDSTREKIESMAKKHDVNFDMAKTLFEATLKEMLDNKEFWSGIKVEKS